MAGFRSRFNPVKLLKQRRSSRWHPSSSSAQQSSPSSPSRAGGLSPAPHPGHARQRGAQAACGKDRLNFLYSLMHMIKKKQMVVEAGDEGRTAAKQFYA